MYVGVLLSMCVTAQSYQTRAATVDVGSAGAALGSCRCVRLREPTTRVTINAAVATRVMHASQAGTSL
jgi:hypothetical protein